MSPSWIGVWDGTARISFGVSNDGTVAINPTREDGTSVQVRVMASGAIDYYDNKTQKRWSAKLV